MYYIVPQAEPVNPIKLSHDPIDEFQTLKHFVGFWSYPFETWLENRRFTEVVFFIAKPNVSCKDTLRLGR